MNSAQWNSQLRSYWNRLPPNVRPWLRRIALGLHGIERALQLHRIVEIATALGGTEQSEELLRCQ